MTLKVLAVDDSNVNLLVVSAVIKAAGFELVTAKNGQEAVDAFRRTRPDIILMDVVMPVMDGIEAARIIKSEEKGRWVPIVFLTALGGSDDLVRGLEAGGDDYLIKPLNQTVLVAKLKTLARSLAGIREKEADQQLATDILARQLEHACLPGEPIAFWQIPATEISGDVVASARSPDGTLFVLLADATGHGLSASICTIPVLTLFFEMVDWGLALPAIVHRINSQLMRFTPGSHFVALAALAIDRAQGTMDAWVGGVPDILVVDEDGTVSQRIPSRHTPIGIREMENDDLRVERCLLKPGQQVLLMSDGLIEASNEAGEDFGIAGLESILRSVPPARRMDAIKEGLARFMGGGVPHDDVTVLSLQVTGQDSQA